MAAKRKQVESRDMVTRLLDDDDISDQFKAKAEVLAMSPAERKPIGDALLALVNDPKRPNADALDALVGMDDDRVPSLLVELARHKKPEMRISAVSALGFVDDVPGRKEALVAALDDGEEDVVNEAMDGLSDHPAAEAIAPLSRRLAKKAGGRLGGVGIGKALRTLGACAAMASPSERDATVALVAGYLVPRDGKTPDPASSGAFDALLALGELAVKARPALDALTSSKDAWLALHAHGTLAVITKDYEQHVPPLVSGLGEKGPAQAAASIALGSLGEVAVPFLEKAMSHKNAKVRKQVERVLRGISSRRG